MDVSVIIVNYHSADLVADCVRSVFDKTEGVSFEVLVVDNASGDDSVGRLRAEFADRIRLIEAEENLGFGKANNLGVTEARGEYLFLLNPDTVLRNDAISILHQFLSSHPDVGVAGGNLFTSDGGPNGSYCETFDSLEAERRNAGMLHLIREKFRQKLRRADAAMPGFNVTGKPKDVAYIYGADMMLSKALFDEMRGFDPDFFMYYEEQELQWRVAQTGRRIVSVPDAEIVHLDGATTNPNHEFNELQFKMRMTGAMTYYDKRYGSGGAKRFYKLRSKRFRNLLSLARVQGKEISNSAASRQSMLLEEAFCDYTKEHGVKNG